MALPLAARAATVAARSPAIRRVALALGVLCFLIIAIPIVAIVAATVTASTSAPSGAALSDIPPRYLADYRAEAARYQLDWAVLAAVGKIECDHGRDRADGCRPYTANGAGAVGPMQFLPPTWSDGHAIGEVRVAVPPARDGAGYAADGDGDGVADIWNPPDAIAGAARMLHANGAPANYRRALFAYNHAGWYVDRVLATAAEYRSGAAAASASVVAVIDYAERFLGSPYVWGGNHGWTLEAMRTGSPALALAWDGRLGYFDCSSLVAWSFARGANRSVGDTTWDQWRVGGETAGAVRGMGRPLGGFRTGDLVFFHSLDHVGIALDAERFIHAPHTGSNVMVSDLATYPGLYGYVRYPSAP